MTRMSQSRPYHHGDLRAALLESAERTLREKGAGSLSLRELAREAGVSHAAPGRHFKDKQALLDALALVGYDRLARALETADEPALPLQPRLTALSRAYLAFATQNPELLALMYARKHEPEAAEQMAAGVDRTVGSFERVIADAQRRGEIIEADPERLTLFTGAALHGIASFTAGGMLDATAALGMTEDLIHHLLHGLRPR
ncbi:TetR/AcrR family transcriptional regulator [Streptomyces sp. TRM 70351]|uniref:TetR/AcrR family transcriptional regulator n=1 Tax=Streptomyces sp. TRM 70351 TaxID=3116552 RepID=UPI002E7AE3D9|nr:TetR/AcrR family transcriptional regulator [Streptomyces sp. TRM 70351]MEE1927319.1 TetR/AcrR family transcriptional regulator [Streptomyces sp. TRM 70351]